MRRNTNKEWWGWWTEKKRGKDGQGASQRGAQTFV